MHDDQTTIPPSSNTPGAGGEAGFPGGDHSGPTGIPNTSIGRVLDMEIERELQESYLTYAMSTIMDRALPDVRDGLKPSQRRILVTMNDLNLRPGRKHLKCAKIAGNTSGDYHPHGEAIVYPTLVILAQRWKMRVPLIDPQGNFGSIEGDPPAAMRYTEARMHQAAVDMLADLKLDTVDFQPNYDDRLLEPMVLPGKFPNLLINGGMGIAVGMSTSLPPHNPTEVFDSIIRVIQDPSIGLGELMTDVTEVAPGGGPARIIRHGIKGPDFPTGGVIHGRGGIIDAYSTGRGKISLRGKVHVEGREGGRQSIIIDEIPYALMQLTLVEKIVEAIKDERLTDISDVRNESGRQAQTRIVIELKKNADPAVVENQLFQHTPLQQTFSIINIALVNRRPKTLGLRELIDCYIDHRSTVIRRRTAHLLREAKKKAHVLEGMIYAVCDIDEVIRLIRASRTRDEAIRALMDRRFGIPGGHKFAPIIPARLMAAVRAAEARGDGEGGPGGIALTRIQAETIGSMRLIQLVGLEIERIVADYATLLAEIEGYEAILGDNAEVLAIIRADCEEMRARYNSPRLTSIENDGGSINVEALIKVEDMAVTISHLGYVKRVPASTYRSQGRGGRGIIASDAKDDDFIEHVFVASTHDDLLVFTDTGRVYKMKVYELPEMSRTSKGRAFVNLLELKPGERTCAYLAVASSEFEHDKKFLTFVSRHGIVKRTLLREYRNVNRSGLIAVGLKDGDHLLDVGLTSGSDDLLLVTADGQAIRFPESDARFMGRSAAGVKGIELAADDQGNPTDEVIGFVAIRMMEDADGDLTTIDDDRTMCLLTITENGYGKRTFVDEYRVQPEAGKARSQSRGGKGRTDTRITAKNGRSVAALGVHDTDDVVVITKGGLLVRMSAGTIRECGRGAQGVRVSRLSEGDQVVAAARVDSEPKVESEPSA